MAQVAMASFVHSPYHSDPDSHCLPPFEEILSQKKLAVRAPPPEPVIPREPDADWLRRHLELFKKHMEENPADPRLVDELTKIVRNYYARKLDYPVRTLTTKEFSHRFGKCDTGAPEMVALFTKCDAIKFAKESHVPYETASDCLQTVERSLLCI